MRIRQMITTSRILGALVLSAVILIGCQTRQFPGRGNTYSDIAYMSVWASTPLLDINDDRRPDGVTLRIYLYRHGRDAPVAGNGGMKFQLFTQSKGSQGGPKQKNIKVWAISADQVRRSAGHDQFGYICHKLSVYWRDELPVGRKVYIRGQFIPAHGNPASSKKLLLPTPTTRNVR